MNNLRIQFNKKNHPYPETVESEYEAWGELIIQIVTPQGVFELKKTQWDLAEVIEWFQSNNIYLLTEELEIDGDSPRNNESLSQALCRLYDREFKPLISDESTNWFGKVDSYLERHVIDYGTGSRIGMIVIGLNGGFGEISLYWNNENWAYFFDMNDFLNNLNEKIVSFSQDWLEEKKSEKFIYRMQKIIEKVYQ